MEVVPLLFQPAGGVHFSPATVSAHKDRVQIRRRKKARIFQLWRLGWGEGLALEMHLQHGNIFLTLGTR
jgi:hypothetical protein